MDLLKKAKKAAEQADAPPELPPLKDRAIAHVLTVLDRALDPKDVSAKGGKVARFSIDGIDFTYEQRDYRTGWILYVGDERIFTLEDLARVVK